MVLACDCVRRLLGRGVDDWVFSPLDSSSPYLADSLGPMRLAAFALFEVTLYLIIAGALQLALVVIIAIVPTPVIFVRTLRAYGVLLARIVEFNVALLLRAFLSAATRSLHCGTMLLTFGLVGVSIVHLFRTGNMLAFPIYWYLYMWRQPGEPCATIE